MPSQHAQHSMSIELTHICVQGAPHALNPGWVASDFRILLHLPSAALSILFSAGGRGNSTSLPRAAWPLQIERILLNVCCIYNLSVAGRGKWCTGQLPPLRCWRWPSKLPLPSSHLYPSVSCLFWNCVLACLEFLALPIVSAPYPVPYSRCPALASEPKNPHAHTPLHTHTRTHTPATTRTRTQPHAHHTAGTASPARINSRHATSARAPSRLTSASHAPNRILCMLTRFHDSNIVM